MSNFNILSFQELVDALVTIQIDSYLFNNQEIKWLLQFLKFTTDADIIQDIISDLPDSFLNYIIKLQKIYNTENLFMKYNYSYYGLKKRNVNAFFKNPIINDTFFLKLLTDVYKINIVLVNEQEIQVYPVNSETIINTYPYCILTNISDKLTLSSEALLSLEDIPNNILLQIKISNMNLKTKQDCLDKLKEMNYPETNTKLSKLTKIELLEIIKEAIKIEI